MSVSSDLLNTALTARAPPAAVLFCPGEALRRHGGKPRKDGADRKPSGQIRYPSTGDPGHEMTLAHRAAVVGWRHAQHEHASHTAGQALLLGWLELGLEGAKPEEREVRARRRYDAIKDFAGLHARIFGSTTAQSNLKHQIASSAGGSWREGDDTSAALRLGRKISRVRRLSVAAYHTLQLVACDEGPVDQVGRPDVRLLSLGRRLLLCLAAEALMGESARGEAKAEHTITKLPRERGLEVRFDRGTEGPDNAALLLAIDKLKGTISAGR